MSNKTEIFQPVPMRMTPSSMAARTSHPYQVSSRKWVTHLASLLIRYQEEPSRDENSIESKRRMYLNLDRTPADGSSSAQVILYCSTLQEQSIQLKHSCNYYLQTTIFLVIIKFFTGIRSIRWNQRITIESILFQACSPKSSL